MSFIDGTTLILYDAEGEYVLVMDIVNSKSSTAEVIINVKSATAILKGIKDITITERR